MQNSQIQPNTQKRNMYDKIVQTFNYALKLNPSNGIANYYIGKLHLEGIYVSKNETEAKNFLSKAFQRYNTRFNSDENDAAALYRLAKIASLNVISEIKGRADEFFTKASNVTVLK
jgi:TPR repeat protein